MTVLTQRHDFVLIFDVTNGNPNVTRIPATCRGWTLKPKLHRADEVQLCAQALCLEEMTAQAVPEGALYYAETHRRVVVPFDAGRAG